LRLLARRLAAPWVAPAERDRFRGDSAALARALAAVRSARRGAGRPAGPETC
jgi:hypothetical protein